MGRIAYGQYVFNAIYNLVPIGQHVKLQAVPVDKYYREKLENTKDKLMQFRFTLKIFDKQRVESVGKKHGNGGGTYHQDFHEHSPLYEGDERMRPTTKSPMAILRTCQAARSANGWMQMAGSGMLSQGSHSLTARSY